MRQGFSKVIGQAIWEGRLPWLVRQALKYVGIRASYCLLNGATTAGPLMGVLILTNRCNSRCAMCDITTRSGQELTGEQAKAVIRQLMAAGSSGIGITGGEPLLHPDIISILSYARSFGIPVTLNTNGLLLDKPGLLEAVLQADPTNINISLDGGEAVTHDALRGGPFFQKTIANIKELAAQVKARHSRTTVTVVTVISSTNYLELPKLLQVVKDSGADRLGVMPLHNTRKKTAIAVIPDEALLKVPQYLATQRVIELDNSSAYVRSLRAAWQGKRLPVMCNAGYTSLFVDSSLRVYPCLGHYMMDTPSYQLSLEPGSPTLSDIWFGPDYHQVRRQLCACRQCYLNCQAELSYLITLAK